MSEADKVLELCRECFPVLEEVVHLVERARSGERAVPVVGDGSPGTQVGCAHGSWRLGDVLPAAEAGPNGCTGTKADGSACAGRAGEDGRCAAHKDTP